MGASVSIVDFDRDGWSDIYVVNKRYRSKNALYRNLGDGTFKDVAGEASALRMSICGHRSLQRSGVGRLRQ